MAGDKLIKDYIKKLEKVLEKADSAVVADAIDDAEEHLTLMAGELIADGKCLNREKAVKRAIIQYGSPKVVAAEYLKQDDSIKKKRRSRIEKRQERSLLKRTFGPYTEGRTYKNMLYLFLMFPLGIIYFTYIITGISVSLGLIITIIGIPLLILFLMSIKGIAWFQGRLTESLLGIRMPRKRRKHRATGTRWQRLKINLKNPRLYSSMLCLFLMYPLGIIYFTVIITFMAVSLGLISTPILYLLSFNVSVPVLPAPLWFHCLTMILGLVMATWSLHLVNIMARLHGRMTKKLLLRK